MCDFVQVLFQVFFQVLFQVLFLVLYAVLNFYYLAPNFDGEEASNYGIILNYYYLVGKFGISYKSKFQGKH